MSSPFAPPRPEITWVGHATTLIELDGVRILTDPALTPRLAHLRRHHQVETDGLAPDVVLISHIHMDHLHMASLRLLLHGRERPLSVVVPHGARRLLPSDERISVTETRVGHTHRFASVTVETVKAVHSHSRGPHRRVRAEAVGFVVRGADTSVYFAGDTDLFDEMAHLNADVSLVPIGGWGRTVGPGHLDAHSAVDAVRLLGDATVVPIHWGTYSPLALRAGPPQWLTRPVETFASNLTEAGLSGRVHLLEPGGTMNPDVATDPT